MDYVLIGELLLLLVMFVSIILIFVVLPLALVVRLLRRPKNKD